MSDSPSIIGFPRSKRRRFGDGGETIKDEADPTAEVEAAMITPVTGDAQPAGPESARLTEAVAPVSVFDHDGEDPGMPLRDRLGAIVCLVAALGWTGFSGWLGWRATGGTVPTPEQAAALIATASAPLALIGVVWLLLMRGSRREARRFAHVSDRLRAEAATLETGLAAVSDRLERDREVLAMHIAQLAGSGDEAAARLASVGEAVRADAELLDRHSLALKAAATQARSDMSVLLSGLPKAQAETRQIANDLRALGQETVERTGALDARYATLAGQARAAHELAETAATRLAEQAQAIDTHAAAARDRIAASATDMDGTIEAALTRAAHAVDETRKSMDAQGAALLALTEQGRAALAEAGTQTGDTLARRFAEIDERMRHFSETLDQHERNAAQLFEQVEKSFGGVDAAMTALDQHGTRRTAELADAVAGLTTRTATLRDHLNGVESIGQSLIDRAEALLVALDANAREIEETLPAALTRLDDRTRVSREALAGLLPHSERLDAAAALAAERLGSVHAAISDHEARSAEIVDRIDGRVAAIRDTLAGIDSALAGAESGARRFADGAGADLVAALVRVRETAAQAAGHARETLDGIVADTSAALARASKDVLAGAVTDAARQQLADIAATSEAAVDAARKATDRLMRQMLTIADTTAAVEKRIEDARDHNEEKERETFARRVGLLIESLNSTAIDVSKLLSNDVADSAWTAYLKGDRGVFTRRAVRLLDAGEAREIARHYEAEPDFREQVNRYIHDFEAMLRRVLATRDGAPLAVTLLSSDMGKLYVALSQAIERLRS